MYYNYVEYLDSHVLSMVCMYDTLAPFSPQQVINMFIDYTTLHTCIQQSFLIL